MMLKLIVNFTYLLMSLNRYLLVGKDHAPWLESLARSYVKTATLVTFVCSCLLSAITFYQINSFDLPSFLGNDGLVYNSYYDRHTYWWDIGDYFSWGDPKKVNSMSSKMNFMLPIVLGLATLRDVFSYFLFCIFNLAIDVMTVKKLRESWDHLFF
jgi:hypothetical protein